METGDRRRSMCVIRLLLERRQDDGRVYFYCGVDFQARQLRLVFWPLRFLTYRRLCVGLFILFPC